MEMWEGGTRPRVSLMWVSSFTRPCVTHCVWRLHVLIILPPMSQISFDPGGIGSCVLLWDYSDIEWLHEVILLALFSYVSPRDWIRSVEMMYASIYASFFIWCSL